MTTAVEPTKTSADPTPTTPQPAADGPSAGRSPETRKRIAIGAGLAVVLAGAAFVLTGSGRKEQFAQQELAEARAAAQLGDLPTAASGFQTIIDTYRGTEAAQAATIALNQVRLINGQNELAVTGLRAFLETDPDRQYVAQAHSLLGAALENSGRPAEAATAYRAAAENALAEFLRAGYLVDAARALVSAGREPEAAQVYRDVIARYPDAPVVTEARVRLAELTNGTM
jgi:TolA-binding protein